MITTFKNSKGRVIQFLAKESTRPSQAERRISSVLKKLEIKFSREVWFPDFQTPNGGYYRYDFLLPDYGIILEYDGREYHEDKTNDRIKDDYCRRNYIPLFRFSGSDFFNMEQRLKDILRIQIKQYQKQGKHVKKETLVPNVVMKTSFVPVKLTFEELMRKTRLSIKEDGVKR